MSPIRDRLNAAVRDSRALALLPILAAAALAYRDALTTGRYGPAALGLTGTEEWLFSPVANSSPGIIYVLAGWMAIRRLPRVFEALGENGRIGLGALGVTASLLLLVWSHYTSAPDLAIASFSILLVSGGFFLAGREGGRAMCLPAVFLAALAIPLPSAVMHQLIFSLQLLTSQLTAGVLSAFGLSIGQSADLLLARETTFQVIETCSGFRMIQTLIMAAVVYAEVFHRSRRRLVLLLLTAPVLGILVNLFRVISLVLSPGSNYVPIHTAQGIVMLILGVLLLVAMDHAFGRLFPDPPVPERSSVRPRVSDSPRARLPRLRIGLLTGGLLLAAGVTFQLTPWTSPPSAERSVHAIPRQFGGWQMEPRLLAADPRYLGSTSFSQRTYRRYRGPREETVDFFIGTNDRSSRFKSLLSPKTETLQAGNQIIKRYPITISPDGREISEMVLSEPNGALWLVRLWYDGVHTFPTETFRAALGLDRGFLRRDSRASVVRIAARIHPLQGGESQARERILAFSGEVREQIELLAIGDTEAGASPSS
ncbi:MAG: exosortase/archaeosortase family protein [Myxococcota bacterium]